MKRTVVVDSSVTMKWISLVDEERVVEANKLLLNAQNGSVQLIAPMLSRYEIGSVLLKKKLSDSKAMESLEASYQLPIIFVAETEALAKQTLKIASGSGMSYYDASFVALAHEEKAVLVTDNPKHQGKIKTVQVKSLVDY